MRRLFALHFHSTRLVPVLLTLGLLLVGWNWFHRFSESAIATSAPTASPIAVSTPALSVSGPSRPPLPGRTWERSVGEGPSWLL